MLSVFLSCIAPVISIGFSIAAGPELQQCPCTARMRTFSVPSGPPAPSAAPWHLVQSSKPKGVFLVIRLFLNLCYHALLRGAQGFKFPRWLSSRTKGQWSKTLHLHTSTTSKPNSVPPTDPPLPICYPNSSPASFSA